MTFHEALQHFGSARAACREVPVVAEAIVDREQQQLMAIDGRFLIFGDRAYPSELGALPDAPLGMPPLARSFPRRNRIVSGLSKGVIVIEAAAGSGSLITAQRAAEQGREVFVVPGSPMDPRYAGSNSLIKDGAILVRDVNDILSVLGLPHSARQAIEKPRPKSHGTGYAKVLEALGATPTAVDELVRRCQVSAATVAEVLLALELEGRLERHRGNRVSLI